MSALRGESAVELRQHRRPGSFTLVELLVVVMLLALLAGIAISNTNTSGTQAYAAAEGFAADAAYAQAEAVGRPDLGCCIKVDQSAGRYWLARPAAPDTPITNAVSKKPYVVEFGSNATRGTSAVSIHSIDFGGDSVLGFTSLGGIDQTTEATIVFKAGPSGFQVSISPTTGSATTTEVKTTEFGPEKDAEILPLPL